ncbi:nitroreductase family deazaflavin-dependent oxidoreductase [Nocardia sp. BSTN01]|uniref:nitroreductase/quinone reductase family protein n=1 Tax=Nocardia sp. BSTN01 TaxID=2783665 RepID=UPI00188EC46B|nr:nitroreductase/quinone reductase family protein [Nocardia sp. BSTN01]MBF4998301.1 nitroreductase family deazaflavin-dependent oxidoreductase [Nocardia sp. BSTN01]
MKALIVGASGYNGRNVTRRLLAEGHFVRGLARDPNRAIPELHEVVTGDVVAGTGLDEALDEVDVAFYFVHALDATDNRTDQRDIIAAHRFVDAARRAGLARGVFFTMLAPPEGIAPPRYQRNRLQVEQILRDGIPGMTTLRAGMVVGDGSRAILPYLRVAQRFPIIPLGPWRSNRVSVTDPDTVTEAIIAAGTREDLAGRILDVPASAEPTHEQLLRAIAARLGRRPMIAPTPLATPQLDAALVAAATGQNYAFCRYLLSSNEYDYVVDPQRATGLADLTPRRLDQILDDVIAGHASEATMTDAPTLLAIGRIGLAVMSLAAPRRFAELTGVTGSPELTYMTRIYGARALAMGLGYLTAQQQERDRWKRLALGVDVADTLTGLTHLLRRDVPLRGGIALVALTGLYAAIGATAVTSENARPTVRSPYRRRGWVYRTYAGFIGSEPVRQLMPNLFWKLDRYVMAVTGERFGLPLMLPTAVLETRGAKTGAPRRNPVLYFHDDHDVIVIALNGGQPTNPAWYYNLRQNPDVKFAGMPMRAAVVRDDAERERLWHLGTAVFAPYAKFRRIAAATGRTIPVVRLTPAPATRSSNSTRASRNEAADFGGGTGNDHAIQIGE